MAIQLSDHFDYKKLIRFVLPSIFMMIFTSIYGVVDGLFVSNFVGKTPFAAINFVMPVIMILGPLGFVIGTGGNAIVAKTMGEGNAKLANNYFSMFIYVTMATGTILGIIGFFIMRPICMILGASDSLIDDAVLYGRIGMVTLPFFMLQTVFQSFFITAERPKLGFACTLIAGCMNIVLDALLIAALHWGIVGAAVATGMSELVGGVIPVIFFFSKWNNTPLSLGKTNLNWKILGKTCVNGSSEFMNNISVSVISMAYNWQLLKYAGEDGVATYGMIMYVNFIFIGVIFGYCVGTAPIISYEFGAQALSELKNMFSKSMKLMITSGFIIAFAAFVSAPLLTRLFFSYDYELQNMAIFAMRVFAISFVTSGVNIFISTLFTDLNNGIISAIISFGRTFIFRLSALFILPLFFETSGIWLAVIAADLGTLVISLYFLITRRNKYNYY